MLHCMAQHLIEASLIKTSFFAFTCLCANKLQINCNWFAWCVVTTVALLLLLNDKCKLESLQRVGRPGWRFAVRASCKARTCFVAFTDFESRHVYAEDINNVLRVLWSAWSLVLFSDGSNVPSDVIFVSRVMTRNVYSTNFQPRAVSKFFPWAYHICKKSFETSCLSFAKRKILLCSCKIKISS